MLSLKATVLLGAPLLAAASDILPSRIQRRAALLELLEHQHDRRQNEAYGSNPPPICSPDAGTNDASFSELAAGQQFPDAVYSFTYEAKDAKDQACITAGNCQTACIADASVCFGYTFSAGASPVCTLYGGSGYGGPIITSIPSGFMFLQNAGSTGEGGETVATCATKGVGLDQALANGSCDCGPGRSLGSSAFVCQANNVPDGSVSQPKPLEKPVTFSVPVSWSNSIQGVPAVMTPNQCAATCLADTSCQAYLLKSDNELNSCWKLGSGGVYASPQNDAPTVSGSSTMTKRQAAGTQLGGPGFTFGQTPDSTLVNDAAAPAPSQRARMMRTKRGHNHSQW